MPEGLDKTDPLIGKYAAALLLLLTGPAAAQAAPGRVAVLAFEGPGAAVVEEHLLDAFPKDQRIIPVEQVDAAVQALGKPTLATEYAALGRRLKATALVEGRVIRDEGWRLRLTVRRGGSGTSVGAVDFRGGKVKELHASLRKKGNAWVKALLQRTEAAPDASAQASQLLAKLPAEPAAREEPAAPREEAPPREQPAADPLPPAADPDPPRANPPPLPARDRAEGAVAEGANTAWRRSLLEVSVGPRVMSRAFIFTDNVSGLPGYTLPGAPAIMGEAEVFPAARSKSAARQFGFSGQWETSVGAKTNGRDGERSYETRARSYRAGPRYRTAPDSFTATLGVDYGEHSFDLRVEDALPPNVAYTFLRPSLAAKIEVGSGLSLGVTAAYLHILSVGGLGDADRFPRIDARGAEVGVMLGYALDSDFEIRFAADLRHYAHSMHVRPGDPYVVGGAMDEHFGAAILLNYRMR